jgi:pilus assembly protein CpaE
MSIKISLLAANGARLQRLKENIPQTDMVVELSTFLGSNQEAFSEIEKQKPHLAITDFESMQLLEFARLGDVISRLPQTSIIMLAQDHSPEFLLTAMRSGVREVVPTPLANGELKEAVSRQFERVRLSTVTPSNSRTLGFISAKGGSGATLIATSVAAELASRGQSVGFFDMNMHFGDAHMYMSDKPANTNLVELAKQADRLDSDFLRAAMLPIDNNLWMSPGPDSPERALEIKAAAVEKILATAKNSFSFSILDMGRAVDAVSVKALDACDAIYVVMQYTIPSIHDTKRLLQMLAGLGYSKDRVQLVANRVQKGGDLGADDVQKALNLFVKYQVPNSWDAAVYTANHGVPVMKHAPKSALAKAVSEFAETLIPKKQVITATGGKWLGSFFGSRKSV